MKLNLLPQTVSTANKAKSAWIGSILIAALGLAAGFGLTVVSQNQLKSEKDREAELRPQAQSVVSLAAQADTIMAKSNDIVRNTTLAKEMIAHNSKYTALYDQVLRGVPEFYRITSINAQSTGADSATITMDGVLQSYKQYSDLALSLLRIKGVTTVSRSGYIDRSMIVPNLTEVDQYGRPRRSVNDEPIPDNELDRLAYYERQAVAATGFEGLGGFGDASNVIKTAGPDSSFVRMVINISGVSLQPPDARGMLQGGGGAAAPGAPLGGAAAPGAALGFAGGAGAAGAGAPAASAGGQGEED